MSDRELAIIGVPSSAGARSLGQERAPAALRAAGLISSLAERGLRVVDHGDLPRVEFRPDPQHPKAQNAALVRRVARELAAVVATTARTGALPVVLGGDCSITLGVVAGLLDSAASLGLVYFDADLDLNTPATTPSGIFDGMVVAHLFGHGDPRLASLGPRRPLVEEGHLVFFGHDPVSTSVDPPELAALERSDALRTPLDEVRTDAVAAASAALGELERRVDRILVHFDVDVTSLPAVDVPHPQGLPLDAAAAALECFLASPKCAGLVVTEFNPRHDADGSLARQLTGHLARALAATVRAAGG